ncbi:uncharacterized protein LOC111911994 [Lactuca sativa]|uniref:uncharacterized protein LOC111911994 n=1 Tax=Lactuca sativa TaxID=4236 RepID=UPI001C691451|nr:uncharacterized protein LOC111911994 [Lactuca sativa]
MENLPESLYVDPEGGSSSNSAPKNTARRQPQPQQFSASDRAEIQQLINLLNHPHTRAEAITQLNRVYTRHKLFVQNLFSPQSTVLIASKLVMRVFRSLYKSSATPHRSCDIRSHSNDEKRKTLLFSNGKGGRELGLLLWNSRDTIFSLLEELLGVYKLLSPPKLGMGEATRVCNALALLQCIATHPDTRLELLKAHIPVYIYPFLNTTEKQLVHYDYLRVNSLGTMPKN